MKKIMVVIGVAALLATDEVKASNPLQDAWDSGITNGAAGGGFWRGTTGNYNIASYDLLYNIVSKENGLGAGLIAGGDYMWSGKQKHVFNDVKGGFALNYTLAPFQAFGFTNITVKVYAGDCVATPRSKSVGIGNIAFTGVDWSFSLYKTLQFHLDPAMQTRTGQGEFDRTYAGIQAFLSFKF